MNSIILKELLTNASRHKGEPIPAAIKIIVDYVEKVEAQKDFYHTAADRWRADHDKQSKRIEELESRIDELEAERVRPPTSFHIGNIPPTQKDKEYEREIINKMISLIGLKSVSPIVLIEATVEVFKNQRTKVKRCYRLMLERNIVELDKEMQVRVVRLANKP